jgi:hypothetical protein
MALANNLLKRSTPFLISIQVYLTLDMPTT